MEQSSRLREKILLAPDYPGVYLMRDGLGQILYVGKANSLKKRLLNYLGKNLANKTQRLVAKVTDIEFQLVPNETSALLLEFKLIHQFKPKYNISLKDDKSFPFVQISAEEFPVIQISRKKDDLTARYLGPYTNARLLKNVLKIIRSEFPYRSCKILPKQSCIYYKINLCPAPCIDKISKKEYNRYLDNIVLILEGKAHLLIRRLTKFMQVKSSQRDFEAAAKLRDQVIVLSRMSTQPDDLSCKNELKLLAKGLNLKKLPVRIEGFDISNISGKQATAAMVSFYNGQADKSNYRRFRIKSIKQINDYKMLTEVLFRRYTRLLKEKKSLPDLILIDGGKGHLLTALGELRALNLHIPLVSIAKEKENIYTNQNSNLRAVLPQDGAAMHLIRRVRDEAHRFALSYHHFLRKREIFKKC